MPRGQCRQQHRRQHPGAQHCDQASGEAQLGHPQPQRCGGGNQADLVAEASCAAQAWPAAVRRGGIEGQRREHRRQHAQAAESQRRQAYRDHRGLTIGRHVLPVGGVGGIDLQAPRAAVVMHAGIDEGERRRVPVVVDVAVDAAVVAHARTEAEPAQRAGGEGVVGAQRRAFLRHQRHLLAYRSGIGPGRCSSALPARHRARGSGPAGSRTGCAAGRR
ncbi:hypothetical protein G6F35_014640 [Rhizopus arrhizus]|nr:hypothetical protein G6F35_014640 [Rhizopus arrhizus]